MPSTEVFRIEVELDDNGAEMLLIDDVEVFRTPSEIDMDVAMYVARATCQRLGWNFVRVGGESDTTKGGAS